jgi:hypothetical protein
VFDHFERNYRVELVPEQRPNVLIYGSNLEPSFGAQLARMEYPCFFEIHAANFEALLLKLPGKVTVATPGVKNPAPGREGR